MHILQPVAEHVNAVWSAAKLPTKRDKILQMAASQFVYSRFTIYTNVYRVFLLLGIRVTTADTELAIWLEPDNPRAVARRPPLIQRADKSGLPAVWQRIDDLNVWETLLAKRLIKPDRPLVEHSQWLNERVDELSKAGIFDLIPSL